MEKTSKTILSLIISFVITYSLIVPTSHIFGLEDSSAVNGSIHRSGPRNQVVILNKHQRLVHKTPKQQVSASLRRPMTRTAKRDNPNNQDRQLELLPVLITNTDSTLTRLTVITRHVYPNNQNRQLKLLPVLTTHPQEELGR